MIPLIMNITSVPIVNAISTSLAGDNLVRTASLASATMTQPTVNTDSTTREAKEGRGVRNSDTVTSVWTLSTANKSMAQHENE